MKLIFSADWMTRNLDNQGRGYLPIHDSKIKKEINDIFNIYWSDNVKSRLINQKDANVYKSDIKKSNSQDLNWKYIIITNLKLKTNLKLSKVATIDIGSNAIRLLISNVFEIKGVKYHTKNSLYRVQLRLGDDSFKYGTLSGKELWKTKVNIKIF